MKRTLQLLRAAGRLLRPCAVGVLATACLLPQAQGRPIRASTDPVRDEPPITEEDRQHWAFKPLFKPKPPTVRHEDEVKNDIDRFILQKLEAADLSLAQPADAATLIRRVTFDLTGLPPTADEVRAFEAACGPAAHEEVRKGEAVSREAVTNGSGSAALPPAAARYSPTDTAYEALIDRLLASERYGEAWAQHWLDLARFAETDGFEHDLERKRAWQYRDWVIKALNEDVPFDEFVAWQIAGDEISPENKVATGFLFAGPDMPDTNFQDERLHLLLNNITSTIGGAFLGLTIGCAQCHDHPYDPVSQADFYRLRACFDNLPKLARDRQLPPTFVEAGHSEPVSKVCIRGDHQRPGPSVKAAFPRIANPIGMEVFPVEAEHSSGRRAALARWLTQPTNTLFVRSAANRLWQQHFGQPLAGTPNDFGRQGQAPTHPELLDWLASELPRQGWSLKAMHKLILMSATYRQAGGNSRAAQGVLNHEAQALQQSLYAHHPRRRLTGEELRDALLMVAGRLNLKPGGESVRLPLPPEVSGTLLKNQAKVTADASEHDRRSIYVFARRNLRYPLFDLFDRPDALMSCGRRNESTTAPQSLMLFNSAFSLSMAQSLAEILLTSAGSNAETLVNAGFLRCCARNPTKEELALGKSFLERQTGLTATFEDAMTDYCLALLNTSAFLYVD